ncbi:phage holin family protein [Phaeobacter sp. JH18-32]|uniref:phage holin family protein n=1 Tax=Phaeobacter TaxID=302485 RepID=UPI003A87AABF
MEDQNTSASPSQAPGLLVTVLKQMSQLVQDELRLARAELSRNLSRAGVAIAMIAVGAVLAIVGLHVLAAALVAAITALGLSVGTAALIVGGPLIALAVGLVMLGVNRLSPSALMPDRSLRNVQRDLKTLKETTRHV